MAYLLDANVFIEAKNRHYRFGVCPGFWDWLLQANAADILFSVSKVRDELVRRGDDLSVWAKARPTSFFLPIDAVVLQYYAQIAKWVAGRKCQQNAKADFLNGADPWLIAHALAYRHTVVTAEVPAPDAVRRIKIPDVCLAHSVPYTGPFQMLDEAGARFVLEA
jgi:hypothetical protein